MLSTQDIDKAASRLKGVLHTTPLDQSTSFSLMAGCDVYLKYENLQKTGSFKIRGAYNKISELLEQGKLDKVVASSAGNHAQGVAFAAKKSGIKATSVMPKTTPIAKVKATEDYGAEVILHGNYYDDAYNKSMEIRDETGAEFIHPFNDLSVIAGQGTIGYESLTALPNTELVFVPAGGGGLLAGTAFYLKNINPRIKVIGVQAEGASAIKQSFYEKKLVTLPVVNTIADGISVKAPGDITTQIINEYADDIVTVSDSEISSAILHLLERCKQMVEPAGAASLAAVLGGKADVRGKRCVCILSGGNIDVSFVHRIIEIGLVARNRKLRFKTVMKDVPGSLEEFSKIMSDSYANIVMVQYDRMSADLDPHEVILHIACEVGDKAHGEKVVENLEKNGYRVDME
jgi:threonine dehydratase